MLSNAMKAIEKRIFPSKMLFFQQQINMEKKYEEKVMYVRAFIGKWATVAKSPSSNEEK